MAAYYNEHDTFAASWLRNLITAGLIAPGDVDERGIEDVRPRDLDGYIQCHFFAGIGVWSYALRQAGWTDERPVWTGSCPCQPFSAAGKGTGATDERHLWPAFFHLIYECRPIVVFGEQVDAAIKHGWIDLVQSDLEGIGYAVGSAVLPAAGFGAPHIRHRLWFVGESNQARRVPGRKGSAAMGYRGPIKPASSAGGMAHSVGTRLERRQGMPECSDECATRQNGMVGGFWRDADWLGCRDGKFRPVEPGTFPLANWAPNRVGRLRGYGNAIVAPVAQAFIEAFMATSGAPS